MPLSTKLASILTTDQTKGWQRFLAGFVIFVAGLGITLSSASDIPLLRFLGLALLLGGFAIAMTGYLPMILYRLTAARRLNNKKSQ